MSKSLNINFNIKHFHTHDDVTFENVLILYELCVNRFKTATISQKLQAIKILFKYLRYKYLHSIIGHHTNKC